MAESLAKSLVCNLLGRITDLLINEVKFLSDVADQVSTLQDELQWVQSFLKDADAVGQKEGDERLRTWVSQLRDIAYDAEDAIDTYILRVASTRNQEGALGFLKRSTLAIHVSKHTHHVGMEIEAINKRISKIRERLPTYGMQNLAASSGDNRQHQQRRCSYAHEEEDVVGLDEDINKLVVELTNKDGRARVVSLVGIGGSGKTTLARKLYNHVQIEKHFDCNIWVSISQEWHARDVLLSILTQISSLTKEERELVEKMTNDELVIKVHNFLQEKIYLVVLDDIWVKEAWDELSPVFPRGNAGSKLIFTTRIKDVPLYADPHCLVHESRSLTNEEAWELFLKKVKQDIEDGGREEASAFCELGKKMVKICGGLPLAIVVLGGLLATKASLQEWEKVSRNISLQLRKAGKAGSQRYGEVLSILALSYDNLPYHLKPCFLYLGMFPEDFEIRVKPLIRMWIAEGFMSSFQIGRGETLEDVGEECLQELIQRSMIQVGGKDTTGRLKSCRVHDLIRDLCLEKAQEENFLEVLSSSKFNGLSSLASATKVRRIALHFGNDADSTRCFLLEQRNSHLRSLLHFGPELSFSESQWKTVCTNFPLIRVLHLQRVHFSDDRLPKHFGNLFQLKYLGLQECYGGGLQQSLGNLRSLQTLDFGNKFPYSVGGKVVQKMKHLRYVRLYFVESNSKDFRVGSLKSLQCLAMVKAGDWMSRDLPHLTNLKKLVIDEIETQEQVKAVLGSPCITMDRLHSLSLGIPESSYEEYPSLEELSFCQNLSKLHLKGKMTEKKLQMLQQLPPNLTKLTLKYSMLKEQDPMAALEKLPFLKFLALDFDSYYGTQMASSTSGFPRLQQLEIRGLPELEEWRVAKGAMPHLTHLRINSCYNLRMIPEGLRFMTTLQEFQIGCISEQLKQRLRKVNRTESEATAKPDQGVDFDKIQHIPSLKGIPRTLE